MGDESSARDPFDDVPAEGDPFDDVEMPEGWEPEEEDLGEVSVPESAEHLVTDIPLHDIFARAPRPADAMAAWQLLLRTAVRQKTQRVWVTGRYVAKGLRISLRRARAVLTWMEEMGIVARERSRGPGGELGKVLTSLVGVSPGCRNGTVVENANCKHGREIAPRYQNRTLDQGAVSPRWQKGHTNALGDISSSSSCSEVHEKKEKSRVRARTVSLSFASRVRITEAERDALVAEVGEPLFRKACEMLDAYKQSSGATYNSDAGALRLWAVDAARKRLTELGRPPPEPRRGAKKAQAQPELPKLSAKERKEAARILDDLPWRRRRSAEPSEQAAEQGGVA